MSETILFCFGAVIFIIAFTGAILYGMLATEQKYIQDVQKSIQNKEEKTTHTWEVSLGGVVSGWQRAKTR